jgi:hypothetical protein
MDAAAASLMGLIRPAPLPGGGGAPVRLYTEQDIMEGKAKGQQQQRARFSHPAIPPPLIKVIYFPAFDFDPWTVIYLTF